MDDNVPEGRPTVGLELYAPGIAIAVLSGAHDLSTKAEVAEVLRRATAQRFVLVDLSDCTFLDSTVLAQVVSACQRQWERDGRLELVVPQETSAVQRVIKLAGLTAILTIHRTREEGLASLHPPE